MKRDIAVLVLIVNMVSNNKTKDIRVIMHNMDIIEYTKNRLMMLSIKKNEEELLSSTITFVDKKYEGLKRRLSEVLNS